MRDRHLPIIQSKSVGPVRGSLHQVQPRGHDHLLDVMYVERRSLKAIGIGGSLAAPPLPHYRTYRSVYGGSLDYAAAGFARECSRSDLKKLIGMALWSAGLTASRQWPCGLPAVLAV